MVSGSALEGWLAPSACVWGALGCSVGCSAHTGRHSRKATHHTARYTLILPTGLIREISRSSIESNLGGSSLPNAAAKAKDGPESPGDLPKKRSMIGAPTLIIP